MINPTAQLMIILWSGETEKDKMSGEVDSTPIPTTLETAELNDELKIFDFSHFPLPNRSNKTMRIFYNNVNGLEINQMIATKIQNSKQKQTQQYLGEIESH